MTSSVYQFKIELQDSAPPVWRRIQVPEIFSFWDLHVAIQDAMGWDDYHLHQFRIEEESPESRFIGIPDPDRQEGDMETLAGWMVSIKTYFDSEGASLDYVYDFGDWWAHRITLEQILPQSQDCDYPCCVDGENACPPEDSGGVHGYSHLLNVLSQPDHEEYEDAMAWVGKALNPTEFDCQQVVFDDPKVRLRMMME